MEAFTMTDARGKPTLPPPSIRTIRVAKDRGAVRFATRLFRATTS
jgi:hypothetical protein